MASACVVSDNTQLDNWNSNYNANLGATYAQKLIVSEDVVITAVEMEFDISTLATGASPLTRLQLWTDANGNLGTLIADFGVNVPAMARNQLQGPYYLPQGGVQLARGSNYWIVLDAVVILRGLGTNWAQLSLGVKIDQLIVPNSIGGPLGWSGRMRVHRCLPQPSPSASPPSLACLVVDTSRGTFIWSSTFVRFRNAQLFTVTTSMYLQAFEIDLNVGGVSPTAALLTMAELWSDSGGKPGQLADALHFR